MTAQLRLESPFSKSSYIINNVSVWTVESLNQNTIITSHTGSFTWQLEIQVYLPEITSCLQLYSSNDGIYFQDIVTLVAHNSMSLFFLFLLYAMNLIFLLVHCLSQTVLPKTGPAQHEIHYWLGNDTNKVFLIIISFYPCTW